MKAASDLEVQEEALSLQDRNAAHLPSCRTSLSAGREPISTRDTQRAADLLGGLNYVEVC